MRSFFIALVLATMTASCVQQRYAIMSSHTLAVGDQQTADVLWVQNLEGVLYRCTNTNAGPRCVPVPR